MSKEITCCFSGHRDIALRLRPELQQQLTQELRFLIKQGYRNFIAGGAIGFDTMAAVTVLDLRYEYPDIRLVLVLPCPEQAERWSFADRSLYHDIIENADEVIYTSDTYYDGCMQKRNRYMVDNSSVCVAYITRASSGTGTTLRYCREKGVFVVKLG